MTDAGYDIVRLACLLDDLPVIILGRLRSDRVFYGLVGQRKGPTKGRGPRHGHRLALRDPATQTDPTITTITDTDRYGCATAVAFARMYPKIDARAGWKHDKNTIAQPPIIEGTIIGLPLERLPGDRDPKPVWLWASKPVPDHGAEVDHWWAMFIRSFDLEHTFRFLKQTLGWTRPHVRNATVADRWT